MTKGKRENPSKKVLGQEVGKIDSPKVNTSIGDMLSPQFLEGFLKVLCRPMVVRKS